MVNNEKFSNELNRLLAFIEEKLVEEHPTVKVSLDYFILGIFDQKDSFIYNIFYESMLSSALETLHEAYFHLVSQKALTALRPNREIKYDYKLQKALEEADKEREKLGDEKITSEHVFLAILADAEDDNKIRKVFEKTGISYDILFKKIQNKRGEAGFKDQPEKKEEPKKAEPTGTKPTMVEIKATGDNPSDVINAIINGFGNMRGNMPAGGEGAKLETLTQYCTNLNEQVRNGKIDKIVGREKEINAIIRTLGKRKKSNAILVGEGGVGKTAIVEGLAYLIEKGSVPPILFQRQILSLNMTALMAGTTLRGMLEERVDMLIKELSKHPECILVIDNIDSVLSSKNGQEDFGFAPMLSHALEDGSIQVIGTSDFKGYRNTFDKDPSLERKFQKIIVDAPSRDETLNILMNIKEYYEQFHFVHYTDEAIRACVDLSDKYITERRLPDSAIDILDEVGSLNSPNNQRDEKLEGIIMKLKGLEEKINESKKNDDYETADKLIAEMNNEKLNLERTTEEYDKNREAKVIDTEDILNLISVKTGIPITKLSTDDKTRISTMATRIKAEVIGQDEAVDAVCQALKRNRVGLRNGRTYGTFLFLGGTGRGKSLLAKKIAKEVFGDESALMRFDMSEYMDKTSVNKLIGANPGYIGYERGGLMTEQVKNKKHCVILLDEIEKADPEIYNIFLQVFDEGFLTDNTGQKIDFKNTIIILTSNAGAKAASDFGKGIGFGDEQETNSKRILIKKLRNRFPPEFLNRLDDIIYFNKLTEDNMKDIVRLELNKFQQRVKQIGHDMTYDDSAVMHILDMVKSEPEYGARPIIRAIESEYENKVADLLLTQNYESKHAFHISSPNGEPSIA